MQDQQDYNKKVRAINAEGDAINRSTIFRYQMTNFQQQQIEDKATIEAADEKRKLLEAKGTGQAAATSAGIEGPSVQALLTSFDVATGNDISSTYLQRDNEIAQSRAEQKGTEMDSKNRLISLAQQQPDDPTMKQLGRFFNAAFQTGGAYAQYTTPTKNPDGSTSRRFS